MSAPSDPELLATAIRLSGLGVHAFALDVLDVDPRKVNGWLAGDRPLLAAVRALCMLIIERPALVQELVRARHSSEHA